LALGGLTGFVENPGPGPGRLGLLPARLSLSVPRVVASWRATIGRCIVACNDATMQRLQRRRCKSASVPVCPRIVASLQSLQSLHSLHGKVVALQCNPQGVGATMQRRRTDRAPLGRRLGVRQSRSDPFWLETLSGEPKAAPPAPARRNVGEPGLSRRPSTDGGGRVNRRMAIAGFGDV
jgi:hypothetical protein